MKGTFNLLTIILGTSISLVSMGFSSFIFLQLFLTGRSYWAIDPAVPYELGIMLLGMVLACILFYRMLIDWVDATVNSRRLSGQIEKK